MKKVKVFLWLLVMSFSIPAFSTGEAGTYFNIFIPPSNVNQGKDVSLIVTALYDSTLFRINDTGEDGDNDDSASGMLMAGQSYVLYLRDNGVNDDAAHAGEAPGEQDGDHFNITANKLILVSQAAKSDWEHDWLPATNKSSKGNKFFVYGNEVTTSPNDLNVMAYQDSTYVTIWKISKSTHTGTGYTDVSLVNDTLVAQFMLSPGEDIIYKYHYGRDVLKPGETYLVQSNKDVTMQYGALYTDEQDGGGFVPSGNGTGTGDLFYFAVPFEDSLQQEIRIVSWSDSNNVLLERYSNGQWITVNQFNALSKFKAVEWVGAESHETYATIFRVTCSAGKNVTVFEANWIETGSMVTSDISSMAPSANGNSAGESFAVYMPVPTEEFQVTDPFTGTKLPAKGTHAYIFGNRDTVSQVTVKDASTNGGIINRTYTIAPGNYVDCGLDSAQWIAIYNGTGTLAGGPNRPYLLITSDNPVSVEVNNFNDNWMMYFGAATPHAFDLTMSSNKPEAKPGDTVQFTTCLNLNGNSISNGRFTQTVDNGFNLLSSYLIDSTTHIKTLGTARTDSSGKIYVTYPVVSQFNKTHLYRIINMAQPLCAFHQGALISQHAILSVSTCLNAYSHDSSEMASATAGISLDSSQTIASPVFTLSSSTITEGQTEICTGPCSESTYSWNFGDDQFGSGRIADHKYEETGQFEITLTVKNSAGCSATASKSVKVDVVHCERMDEVKGPSTDSFSTDGFDPSAVNEISNDKTPNIWSSADKVYIDFTGMENVNATINIYDLLGQEIEEEKFTDARLFTRQISNISTGYLVVAVLNNHKLYGKRVLITNRGR